MKNTILQIKNSELISVDELCKRYYFSKPWFYKNYENLPFKVVKVRRRYLISRDSFEKFLSGKSDDEDNE